MTVGCRVVKTPWFVIGGVVWRGLCFSEVRLGLKRQIEKMCADTLRVVFLCEVRRHHSGHHRRPLWPEVVGELVLVWHDLGHRGTRMSSGEVLGQRFADVGLLGLVSNIFFSSTEKTLFVEENLLGFFEFSLFILFFFPIFLEKSFPKRGFVLLMIFRALQGLSAGGEIGAVTAYLMEVSPIKTIGMAICMISVGSQIAWAFASAMLAVLNSLLGPELMLVWGWRIPFLFSALPGLVALWGRNGIQETDVFLEEVQTGEKQAVGKSILELLLRYPLALIVGIGGVCAAATMWFAPPFWTISSVLKDLGASDALWVGNSCQLVGLAITPLAGWMTDRYGVAFTAFIGACYCALVGLPVYLWLTLEESSRAVAYLGIGLFFGLAQGFNGATIYLFCAELFPARLRCQGMALSYNIGVSFVGGFAAAISQSLYQASLHIAPGVYWSATGTITMASVLLGLWLQRQNLIKLTHRRSEPYFGPFGC